MLSYLEIGNANGVAHYGETALDCTDKEKRTGKKLLHFW